MANTDFYAFRAKQIFTRSVRRVEPNSIVALPEDTLNAKPIIAEMQERTAGRLEKMPWKKEKPAGKRRRAERKKHD